MVWATFSQLELLSLTLLSVADRGRLQLGIANWATSVALLQVVDNYNGPHQTGEFNSFHDAHLVLMKSNYET